MEIYQGFLTTDNHGHPVEGRLPVAKGVVRVFYPCHNVMSQCSTVPHWRRSDRQPFACMEDIKVGLAFSKESVATHSRCCAQLFSGFCSSWWQLICIMPTWCMGFYVLPARSWVSVPKKLVMLYCHFHEDE